MATRARAWTRRHVDVSFWRAAALWAIPLAVAAFALEQLSFRHADDRLPTSLYVVAIAVAFTILGACLGVWMTPRRRAEGFVRNEAAIKALKLSVREIEVLCHAAEGASNKEIARLFAVSPNTVKTQLSSVYRKLGATGRTQAVALARERGVIP